MHLTLIKYFFKSTIDIRKILKIWTYILKGGLLTQAGWEKKVHKCYVVDGREIKSFEIISIRFLICYLETSRGMRLN